MKKINLILTTLMFVAITQTYGQHLGLTFQECKTKGLSFDSLQNIYQSAWNVDSSKAVFKTDAEQDSMHSAYVKLLQDLGKYLKQNNFNWDTTTKCSQRIYFKEDGTIDYWLYNFIAKDKKPEEVLSPEKNILFNKLLNQFIQNYKLSVSAKVKFAQCGPTIYKPMK